MTIEINAEISALLVKYKGIGSLYEYQRKNSIRDFFITRLLKTEIDSRDVADGENYHMRIVPRAGHADGESLIILSIIDDGLLEILYHSSDFSDEELRLIDLACETQVKVQELMEGKK